MNVNSDESVLMLLIEQKKIYPLSTFAFTVTQSSQSILHGKKGALILYRDGKAKKIVSITRDGFYGKQIFDKIKSALCGTYKIITKLEDIEVPFPELANLIADFIFLDSQVADPSFDLKDIQDIVKKIRSASNIDEIFNLISMPDPENCLDII
uniref:hypothetical protein n=1 Tax=Candidatus Electronema sp. TaxID=2698783 RepID=UPI0040573215